MLIKFLGTGTSHGVPVIGCTCKTCLSDNPKNKRMRSSLFLNVNNTDILIDTSPELRLQMLANNIENVDLVLFTHAHADHIMGFDDIRVINWQKGRPVPCYGQKNTLDKIKEAFDYIFDPPQIGGGIPQVSFHSIDSEFSFQNIPIIPLPVKHGKLDVFGYKIYNMAYITDCSYIPESTFELLDDIDLLIIDALRFKEHPTHMNLEQAIQIAEKFDLKKAYFTHISHEIEHEEVNKILPDNIELAYDGLQIDLENERW